MFPSSASRDRLWQRLTLLVLGLTALVSLCYLGAFISPSFLSGFLPAARPTTTQAVVLSLPTATPTLPATDTLVPSWTPVPSRTPRPTGTRRYTPTASRTPGPSPTFPPTWTPAGPTGTPPPTRSNYPFALKNNEIIYTQYFLSSDCNWLGIAGLVLDKEGNPITGVPVVLNGGGLENIVTYSGNAPAYGESGWEHFLDSRVKEGDFTVQLYRVRDNQSEPVSDRIQVRTRADCRANLVMVVFELNWDEYTP
jgi:hypothetical protein